MERIIIQLQERTLTELDQAAGDTGMSRAAFARSAIELAIADRRRIAEIAEIVRSFETSPPEDLVPSKATVRRGLPS